MKFITDIYTRFLRRVDRKNSVTPLPKSPDRHAIITE